MDKHTEFFSKYIGVAISIESCFSDYLEINIFTKNNWLLFEFDGYFNTSVVRSCRNKYELLQKMKKVEINYFNTNDNILPWIIEYCKEKEYIEKFNPKLELLENYLL